MVNCSSSASIASAKNLSSPPSSVVFLLWLCRPSPPKRMSVLWFGIKSAFELSRLSSVVRLSSLSLSLKRASAVIVCPWCFSQCLLAVSCLSLLVIGDGFFFFFFFFLVFIVWLYPGWKKVGGVAVVVVLVVVVDEGVSVVVVTALAAALVSSVGLNTCAFAFHFIFTFGGLAGGLVLVPLFLFHFLPPRWGDGVRHVFPVGAFFSCHMPN